MGTVVSIVAPDADSVAIERARAVFCRFDERYSLYRENSELSRIARGELALGEASLELRETYAAAISWRNRTGSAFTPHRPDGVIDLNGIVKALAMRAAAAALHQSGLQHWCLNVGGDVIFSGRPEGDEQWNVGIVDPFDRAAMLLVLTPQGGRAAVATSGTAERGDHIWGSGRDYVQVTVVADDIVTADVLATAIVAGGAGTLELVTREWDVDVLTVAPDGSMLATPGVTRL